MRITRGALCSLVEPSVQLWGGQPRPIHLVDVKSGMEAQPEQQAQSGFRPQPCWLPVASGHPHPRQHLTCRDGLRLISGVVVGSWEDRGPRMKQPLLSARPWRQLQAAPLGKIRPPRMSLPGQDTQLPSLFRMPPPTESPPTQRPSEHLQALPNLKRSHSTPTLVPSAHLWQSTGATGHRTRVSQCKRQSGPWAQAGSGHCPSHMEEGRLLQEHLRPLPPVRPRLGRTPLPGHNSERL